MAQIQEHESRKMLLASNLAQHHHKLCNLVPVSRPLLWSHFTWKMRNMRNKHCGMITTAWQVVIWFKIQKGHGATKCYFIPHSKCLRKPEIVAFSVICLSGSQGKRWARTICLYIESLKFYHLQRSQEDRERHLLQKVESSCQLFTYSVTWRVVQ